MANKITVEVFGHIKNNGCVDLLERYYYNDEAYFIQKLFTFDHNSWSYQITNKTVHVGEINF